MHQIKQLPTICWKSGVKLVTSNWEDVITTFAYCYVWDFRARHHYSLAFLATRQLGMLLIINFTKSYIYNHKYL